MFCCSYTVALNYSQSGYYPGLCDTRNVRHLRKARKMCKKKNNKIMKHPSECVYYMTLINKNATTRKTHVTWGNAVCRHHRALLLSLYRFVSRSSTSKGQPKIKTKRKNETKDLNRRESIILCSLKNWMCADTHAHTTHNQSDIRKVKEKKLYVMKCDVNILCDT